MKRWFEFINEVVGVTVEEFDEMDAEVRNDYWRMFLSDCGVWYENC